MSNSPKTKRGSSRRKGDEFQDLCAMQIILELYRDKEDFEVFLEYEKATATDDIVAVVATTVRAVQAKYAVDPLAVYVPKDFTTKTARTYFGRFAQGWTDLRRQYPEKSLTIELISNRGRDSALEGIIEANGRFADDFIQDRKRGKSKTYREKIRKACPFVGETSEADFKSFLSCFHFALGQRPLDQLQSYLEGEVIDHQLGVSDRSVFLRIKELVEDHAIRLHEPIARQHLDRIFRETQARFLLPQIFPVDKTHFVPVESFDSSLLKQIETAASGYVVVTGLPGSGKSTSLSEFFDTLEKDKRFVVSRYLCFVSPDDESTHMRAEAEALRVNLLSALQGQFAKLLNRRFDYSSNRVTDTLSEIGKHLAAQGRKLVVLLDGLDHAERDQGVRENVLRALPQSPPEGVVFVIGSQELKNWEPLSLKQGREKRHVQIPLFNFEQTRSYVITKCQLDMGDLRLKQLFLKSQGLPLYLRYITEWLRMDGRADASLDQVPDAVDGDIRNYYDLLWASLERDGMAPARYLCGVLAYLRFPILPEELASFQSVVAVIDLPNVVRLITHLLRTIDGQVSIFHDSFRVFVKSKLDAPTKNQIARDILAKLKSERGSARWFSHAFYYAHESGDRTYTLSEINRPFVDFALQRYRPAKEILATIGLAIEEAAAEKDLVSLARLGSLRFRSSERLEQFSYSLLAKVQLALGRINEVLGFCCQHDSRRWLLEDSVAMDVLEWCAASGQLEFGAKLWKLFVETHPKATWTKTHKVAGIARAAGIYTRSPAKTLQYLASFEFQPDIMARRDPETNEYAPQLQAFLETYFLYRPSDSWKRLKRIRRLFPNSLVRLYLLRLVAQYPGRADLAAEVEEYLKAVPGTQSLEVGSYAVMARFSKERIRAISGNLTLPNLGVDRTVEKETEMEALESTAIILGCENDSAAIGEARHGIGYRLTMYAGFARFLLEAGICLGRYWSGVAQDHFSAGLTVLKELASAGNEEEREEMDTQRACRPMLPETLFRLTTMIAQTTPQRLPEWRDALLALRESKMWTRHWAITEVASSYIFELHIWERLLAVPGFGALVRPILQDCAKTYDVATTLKAGDRSHHFFMLAAIAASSGWNLDAEKWREKATACSLTYGYHKDGTLDELIDIFELTHPHNPQFGLERASRIFEMIRWMRDVTNERGTLDFWQSLFKVMLQISREASFTLIRYFFEHLARWMAQDCLAQFCLTQKSGDVDVLWILKDCFKPHFVETGRHAKQVVTVARGLTELRKKLARGNATRFAKEYNEFIRTNIDPGWWPPEIWEIVAETENRPMQKAKDPNTPTQITTDREFNLDGKKASPEEVSKSLNRSYDSFFTVFSKLQSENEHLFDRGIIDAAFSQQVNKSTSADQLIRLAHLARSGSSRYLVRAQSLHLVAQRLFAMNETEEAFHCIFLAYDQTHRDFDFTLSESYLKEMCERDPGRTQEYLITRIGEVLRSDHGGYDVPKTVARFLSAIGAQDKLRVVFEDYLVHCEEMFTHLPRENEFVWLKEYKESGKSESEEMVGLLLDQLDDPEVDQSNRLLGVLAVLAKTQPELVCGQVCSRIPACSSMTRPRLENLLEALSILCPLALSAFSKELAALFSSKDFGSRTSLMRSVRNLASATSLSRELQSVLHESERDYSPAIAYPARRFVQADPSPEFVILFRDNPALLPGTRNLLHAVCELLHIEDGTLLSNIERRLQSQGLDCDYELERLNGEWSNHRRHGHVIAIVPSFHVLFMEALRSFIHECLENGRYAPEVVRALENVVRTSDSEVILKLPTVKPIDVFPLEVTDGDAWLADLIDSENPVAGILGEGEWTSICEERVVGQTVDLEPKFTATTSIRSSLLQASQCTLPVREWPTLGTWGARIDFLHNYENITYEEARERTQKSSKEIPDGPFIPLISLHVNNQSFNGDRKVAVIHPHWINRFKLKATADGYFSGDDCIGKIERWQEGYEEDAYSRDKLSFGYRLRVKNSWLKTILSKADCALVIATHEARKWLEDSWSRKPAKTSQGTKYKIFVS